MYRVASLNKLLMRVISVVVLTAFTYYSLNEQINHRHRTRPIELRVSRKWIERFRIQRSLLLLNKTQNSFPPLASLGTTRESYRESSTNDDIHRRTHLETTSSADTEQGGDNHLAETVEDVGRMTSLEEDEVLEPEIKTAVANFNGTPPNSDFIFHNKLPKSGSSTMNNLLKVLQRANEFNFLKMEAGTIPTHTRDLLAECMQSKIKPPYLLLKHHYWMNFSDFNIQQPTFINVIRHPIDWFTSRYYFQRYGWKRKPGCRSDNCGMSKEDREMNIDECVAKRHKQCTSPWAYLPFFCGTSSECTDAISPDRKRKSLEIAKKRLVDDFYLVGILEQFEDTLNVLEKILPRYFKGAVANWKGKFVQDRQELSRTTYKQSMSEDSRRYFENGPLKYEIELYEFTRNLFNAKMKKLEISPTKLKSD